MQFRLRTLLIVLGVAPPLLAGLFYVLKATREYWALPFALWPLFFPFAFTYFMSELGTILQWVFHKQIEEDKARIAGLRERKDI